MNGKYLIIAALVAGFLTSSLFWFTRPSVDVNAIVAEVKSQVNKFGAVASPDIPSPYLQWGGVYVWSQSTTALNTASTTICALQSPAATSTLLLASVKLDVSSTSASTLTLAKATTAFATTTLLAENLSVAANNQATLVSSSTLVSGTRVFGPNNWVVASMSGGAGTFSPTGKCQATWIQN